MTDSKATPGGSPEIPDYIGTYQVVHSLGEGAFGLVYQAYQPFLDRQVAIKLLHADLTSDRAIEQQFMNEARTIARLRHPNIVSVYEFGVLPRDPNPLTYMVMEYLPGETLQARLARAQMPFPEVVRVAEQLAEGLDYAHAHSVIHRDLKPSNILFSEQNQPVIVDFGLAKLIELSRTPVAANATGAASDNANVPSRPSDQTSTTGTPAYMSPEQVMGVPTSAQSDQYTLALMLYEMLTGKQAFIDEHNRFDISNQLMRRVQGLPEPVQTLKPEIPQPVNAVLTRALAFSPQDRYPTVAEFARDLGDALLPDRRRAQVQVVTDPVQATLLKASRQTILYGLWGILGLTALVMLFCISLFVRSFASSASIFVSDGLILADSTQPHQHLVIGFWPGSVAQQAGVQLGDTTDVDLSTDAGKVNANYKVNGQPRSALPPDWQPSVKDTVEQTFIRDGQPLDISYKLGPSSFNLLLLVAALVPVLAGFIGIMLLLRRWGAEPGMQLFTIVNLAGSTALLSVALLDIVPGLLSVALYTLFPAFIHFVLVFPEPVRFLEHHPRRLWWLYVPLAFGIFQFLWGAPILIGSLQLDLFFYIAYSIVLTAAIILKWGRHDLKRYPGLWGMIAIMLATSIASMVPTIVFSLDGQTTLNVFGNGLNRWAVGYGTIFIGVLIGIILSAIGYHLVQRQLGPSLVTQISQSSGLHEAR